jgi:hypothetical protein
MHYPFQNAWLMKRESTYFPGLDPEKSFEKGFFVYDRKWGRETDQLFSIGFFIVWCIIIFSTLKSPIALQSESFFIYLMPLLAIIGLVINYFWKYRITTVKQNLNTEQVREVIKRFAFTNDYKIVESGDGFVVLEYKFFIFSNRFSIIYNDALIGFFYGSFKYNSIINKRTEIKSELEKFIRHIQIQENM